MKTTLSSEQISQYQRDGFLHVPQFLQPSEIAELKTAVLRTASAMGKKKVGGEGVDWKEGEDFYDKVFTQRLNLWKLDETVKRYVTSPALGEMACRLEGIDGARLWLDQVLIKEPYANATAWHLDCPYWSFHSRRAISIWIALEDATFQNGCLYFLPGTHHKASFENVGIGINQADLFRVQPKLGEIDSVAAPMKAGDCSFHNGLVAHAAGANMGRGRRIAMTAAFMPEGSRFNGRRDILPQDYFETLKEGDILDNDNQNPLLYSKHSMASVEQA